MKGLIRNNLFAVYTNAKIFLAFMLLAGIFCVTVTSQTFQMWFVMIFIVGLSIIAAVALNTENTSKWGKYKITLPIKRVDIITSLFFNHIFWLFVGMIVSAVEITLSWTLHNYLFEQFVDVLMAYALAVSISFVVGAFFLPLYYLIGEDKGIVNLVISFLCAFGFEAFIVTVLTNVSKPLGVAVMVGSSFLIFVLSYPVTIVIFKKKEY